MSYLPSYDYVNTLLEDVFEPILDPYCPVVVIDFKVYAHAINKYAELASEVAKDEEELKTIMKAMWAYKLNRGPDMLSSFPFVGVVVDDLNDSVGHAYSGMHTTIAAEKSNGLLRPFSRDQWNRMHG